MATSYGGFGTEIIAASRERKNDNQLQYDAIEAIVFSFLPFWPQKALHILATTQEPLDLFNRQHNFVPLRLSAQLVFRAILNRWGNCLAFFGGGLLIFAGYGFYTMARPMNNIDRTVIAVSIIALLAGIVCKIAWHLFSRRNEKIRDLIGPHSFGFSDPWDWNNELARGIAQSILKREEMKSLVEVARRYLASGNRAYAAYCLRLAMRNPKNREAQEMMEQLLEG